MCGSYANNVERVVTEDDDVPDTVQWWVPSAGPIWRIRTCALDHDIHPHRIEKVDAGLAFARSTTRKHYSEVLRSEHEVAVDSIADVMTYRAFEAASLDGHYKYIDDNYVLWTPDAAPYLTQTTPKKD